MRLGTPGSHVPGNFVGFAVELNALCTILSNDEKLGAAYESLYTNLGKGTLHIGGHSADLSVWQPFGVYSCDPEHPVVTRVLMKALFAFAHHIGWQVSWTLPLIANDPGQAASEAVSIARIGGSSLVAFSIGNEPELYPSRGERPSTWGYDNYRYEWEQVRKVVLSSFPHALFEGPDICCKGPFFANFLIDEQHAIAVATHHYYTRSKGGSYPSIAGLLSQSTNQGFANEVRGWVALANQQGLPLEITESNTISGGGAPGVSDTLAAALWGIGAMMQAATAGVAQFDLQEASDADYNAISASGSPQAIYEALLFVHTVTTSARILPVHLSTARPLLAFATQNSAGQYHVILVNDDLTRAVTVAIETGRIVAHPSGQRIEASSIAATQVLAKNVSVTQQGKTIRETLPAGSAEDIVF